MSSERKWTRRPPKPGWYWFIGDALLFKVGAIEFDKVTIVKIVKTKDGFMVRWGMGYGKENQIDGLFYPVGDEPPMPRKADWPDDEVPQEEATV